ncbi:MAG: type II toxin-antitoxin system RelE family toxin [Candidatus Limnocylindria bacterium]
MSVRVQLSRRAVRDLTKLGRERRRVERLLAALGQEPRPANLDLKPLRGREPWSRARAGSYRVIIRPLTGEEVRRLTGAAGRGYLVARIVHRRDLERAIGRL